VIWIGIVVALYPACRSFAGLKQTFIEVASNFHRAGKAAWKVP
jgi:hypothetical protein